MNRSTFARGKAAIDKKAAKAARPKNLVPRATGARVDKGKLAHLRSDAHLKLVRAQPCLVSRALVGVIAHHTDELFPHLIAQQMKISDFLAVPLHHDLHDPGMPGSIHKSNNMAWWIGHYAAPYRWLRGFLRRHYQPGHPGADYALAQIAIVENRRST